MVCNLNSSGRVLQPGGYHFSIFQEVLVLAHLPGVHATHATWNAKIRKIRRAFLRRPGRDEKWTSLLKGACGPASLTTSACGDDCVREKSGVAGATARPSMVLRQRSISVPAASDLITPERRSSLARITDSKARKMGTFTPQPNMLARGVAGVLISVR